MAGINSWARGIIIAIIVGIIIQMILPEGKNKKYIKVIIGVYTLFCIISPVIGKNIDLENYNIEKYLSLNMITKTEDAENTYDENVQEMFKNKMSEDIKDKIKSKGYMSNNIQIEIDSDCNITKIKILNIYKLKENKDSEQNKIQMQVNKIEVGTRENDDDKIEESEKNMLVDYINENYKVDKKDIVVE